MNKTKTRLNNKESIKRKLLANRAFLNSEPDTCWLWLGFKSRYGQLEVEGKCYSVNRLSLYAFTDDFDINDSTILACHKDDICKRKDCFNPNHLYAGTVKDNSRDWSKLVQSDPTFKCGHPRTDANSYICAGHARCRLCNLTANVDNYYKNKEK